MGKAQGWRADLLMGSRDFTDVEILKVGEWLGLPVRD